MANPSMILIGGSALRWQEICKLRRQQLEAWKAAQPRQLAFFELKDDRRPAAERTAAGRYAEPTFHAEMPPPRKQGMIAISLRDRPPCASGPHHARDAIL